MAGNETQLKQQLKSGDLLPLYWLYGEESYLTAHYTERLAAASVGQDEMGSFNLVRLDGTETDWDRIEDAALSLPLMSDRKCVIVRDFDPTVGGTKVQQRMELLLSAPPETCVLIFCLSQLQPDMKKNAKWRHFAEQIDRHGMSVCFDRRTDSEAARTLCAGAQRRKVTLSPEVARAMVAQCGNDLFSLLGELEKLCALAGEGGTITASLVETAATKHLEASIYDLSKAILRHNYTDSYTVLSRLFYARERAVDILARLSAAYADLYRAKAASVAGVSPTTLATEFNYRGREFVLKNAMRDSQHLSLAVLRQSLDLLAETDTRLKSSRCDERVVLEVLVAQLIVLAKGGTLS